MAELTTHFMLQYALAALALLAAYILLSAKPWRIALAAILLIYFSAQSAAMLLPKHVSETDDYEDISILQFNVNYANAHMDKVSNWITKFPTQPDIVILQEVSPNIAANLQELEKAYPYKLIAPKPAAFGAAIFSKIPFKQQTRASLATSWNEYSEITFETKSRTQFTLTELHTIPPMDDAKAVMRNQQLEDIAAIVNAQPASHKILVGDFNITPYSPFFRKLQSETKLTSAMQGRTLAGTWPSFYPGILRIPIDHLLVSDNIKILNRKVQPNMHSDHLPIFTKLRLYK